VIDRLRSEFLKLRSTRTTLGLVLGMLALTIFVALVQGYTQDESSLALEREQHSFFQIGGVSTIFAALVGVMAMTSEFRHGTIRPTLLSSPRRSLLLVSKLLASLVMGLLFGLVAEAAGFLFGVIVFQTRGIAFALDRGDVAGLVAGTVAASLLWAGIGVGVGALVRSQVGAIIAYFAWIFVGENILFGLVARVGRYSPGPASQALAGAREDQLLAPLAGGLVLCGWVALFCVAGGALLARRDID
jgi:ABC-2 type transport system permease protein